jgi:glycosyltransferase involved in cell wall biosynthesis
MNADGSASRKKILFVITKANWGGAQKYVYELATAMVRAGHEVAVAYGVEGHLADRLRADGIRALPVETLSREVNFKAEWASFKSLLSLIRSEKPDIVHVNSSKAGLALLASRIAGVQTSVFTAHGWAFNEKRPWWQKWIMYGVYATSVLLANVTICVSDAVRRDVAWLPAGRRVVILHGMDAPEFIEKQDAREKLLPHTDGTWIGMLAELHPSKRVEDAIDALAELKDSHPELRLVVMGDGELKEWLAARAEHYGLSDRVHPLGFVEDAPKYLKAFDLFLMISRTEALGLALIEAGYAGLPVVAARAGGIPEVVRHKKTGILVPRENPHTLARALRLLLESPDEMKTYGEALAEDTRARFGKERMIMETLHAYGV